MTESESGRYPSKGATRTAGTASAARATEVTAGRIRQLRKDRGLSAAALAQRCSVLGAPSITPHVIASIETHRRGISVDELLAFALALDVPPAQLLTPPAAAAGQHGTGTVLALTATMRIQDPEQARRWIIGEQPLPGTQEHLYYAYALEHAKPGQVTEQALSAQARAVLREGAAHLAAQYEAQIEAFTHTMRTQVTDLLDDLDNAVNGTPEQISRTVERVRSRLGNPSGTTP
ncbi:helix-turn-helix transcriptional regulator [Kineosporia sp. NBRC 101731]|uniref:helix-turn-helix domain-containing protein n=1 Tax=Kineosporia sp. NBRC 101731 TaxID=3032199 RepID=UPI0025573A8D|nr:helix-turn-helix transcriptional regulator [Kineosporia sp. NBRC 101731]